MKQAVLWLSALLSSVSGLALSNRKVYEIDNSVPCGAAFDLMHFAESYTHVLVKGFTRVNCQIVAPTSMCLDVAMIETLKAQGVVVSLQIGGGDFAWDSTTPACTPDNWSSLQTELTNIMLTEPTTYKMLYNGIHFSYVPNPRSPWTPGAHNTGLASLQAMVSTLKTQLPPFEASIEIQDVYVAKQSTSEYQAFSANVIPLLEKTFETLTIRTGLLSSMSFSLVLEPTSCVVDAVYGTPPCSSPQTLLLNVNANFGGGNRIILSSCVGSETGCVGNVVKPISDFIAGGCYGGFSAIQTTNSWGVASHFTLIDMPSWNITESRRICMPTASSPAIITDKIIELSYYGPASPLYKSSRYDWSSGSGAILTRAVDEFGILRFNFDVSKIPDEHNPTNPDSVFGFMAEFGCGAQSQWCDTASQVTNGVLGFETNQAEFLKIGVGKLSRSRNLQSNYDPSVAYPIVTQLTWNTSCTSTSCTFKTSDTLVRGAVRWGYDLTRTVTMSENGTFSSDVFLSNTGTGSFRTAYTAVSSLSIGNYTWGDQMSLDFDSFKDFTKMTCPTVTSNMDCLTNLRKTREAAAGAVNWYLAEPAITFNLSGMTRAGGSFAGQANSGSNFQMYFAIFSTSQTAVSLRRTFTAGSQLVLSSLQLAGMGPMLSVMGVYHGVDVPAGGSTQWSESSKAEVIFKPAPGSAVAVGALILAIVLLVLSIGCIVAGNKLNVGGAKEEGMTQLEEEDNPNPMHPEDQALE